MSTKSMENIVFSLKNKQVMASNIKIIPTKRYLHPGQIFGELCYENDIEHVNIFIYDIFTKFFNQWYLFKIENNNREPNPNEVPEFTQIMFYLSFGSACSIGKANKTSHSGVIKTCYFIVCSYTAKFKKEQSNEGERCNNIEILIQNKYYFNKSAQEDSKVDNRK